MIYNLTGGNILSHHPVTALGFFRRCRGMIGRRFHGAFDAMVFERCNAIHMLFMSIPLDVVFVDRDERVTAVFENLPPWRLYAGSRGAATAIELPAGTAAATKLKVGDQLSLKQTCAGAPEGAWYEGLCEKQ